MATAGGNIKVVVRVRPFNSREIERNAQCIVSMKNNQTVLSPPADGKSKSAKAALEGAKTFAFDKSYWSFNRSDSNYAGQENLHDDLGRPLLDNAFQGYNNCIFAYGQTGSGKSYSMMGYGEEYGVIPRICKEMFDRIATVHENKNLHCTVEVSYLEIYNERVRDLLNPSTKGNLRVREHPSTGPYVEDLAKLAVRSFDEIENLMDEGNKARTVAATNMNETSSRSHAVFTLTLTQKRHDVETRMDTEKVAKISLVDLAGSERATFTGATGARLKEGAEINRSLSTLGRVIASLADLSTGKKKGGSQVPYRDSVLTWLLKDSLGGNSLTAMIAAISPADINFEETLSTLRYADSAKRIKNHAVVNEDPNARMIRELKEELALLRTKLSGGGIGAVGVPADEQYAPDTPLEQQIVSITQADGTIKKVSKAEIAEQLSQSEKLYSDLNQTWEEKLHKTEQIHKEREAALEELGISIEKGFVGMSTPKKMPHLVNLSDDPLLAECLVYNLKPGTTTVGNDDTETTAEIRLNGSMILHDHCAFENVDGAVTVVPKDNAAVMVNGQRIEKPKRLRSGYRIILGDFHIFRFNNPQEARAERAEHGSLLRHAINASDVDVGSPSPIGRPSGHVRSLSSFDFHSGVESDLESNGIASSPTRERPGAHLDWSFARREAVSAVLGSDHKISSLTDDELDGLFNDLQRVRAVRKARPESKFLSGVEDDSASESTFAVREKYASNGTLDNFSLDTVLTIPSTTPQVGEEDDRLRYVREELQTQLDKQKKEYQEKLKAAEASNVEIAEIREEKKKMEASLQAVKEEMQNQLKVQREEFERQISQLREHPPQTRDARLLQDRQVEKIRQVLHRWQQCRYVSMAETVLRNAALLKEAQIMSQHLDKNVVFQFCVVDAGHTFPSTYDLVLSGSPTEDDEELDIAPKPCIAVRIIDSKHHVVHLWSLQKLRKRLRIMRDLYQYANTPDCKQRFKLDNPFSESCLPQYTRIGDCDVPLTAVFEMRVQDFSLDIVSPYTSNPLGMARVSVEPSSAEAPPSTMKFNVVMHDMIGFPEREGTEVHAQLFVPGISDESGATTTAMIKGFDEGSVRFESVHSMSLPLDAPRSASLRIAIFAKVTGMHMDKLLSWDDMRDAPLRPVSKRKHPRLPESEFYTEEKHDIFARIQFHEISVDGTYRPVEVVQTSATDGGAFQLHQGLQRRITIGITQNSGRALPWGGLKSLRIGHVRLVDAHGNASELETRQNDVPVKLTSLPSIEDNADGTSTFSFTGQWDSSMHTSPLLDRPTHDRHRVQVTLFFNAAVTKPGLQQPLPFSVDLTLQMRPRSYVRPTSMLGSLFNQARVVHSSTAIFQVVLRPSSAKRATDLWRMDTRNEYVKGEEKLSGWTPRGVSLVEDFVRERKRKWRVAEIEAAKAVCHSKMLATPVRDRSSINDDPLDDRQRELLQRCLDLWQSGLDSPLAKLFSQFSDAADKARHASQASLSRLHNGDSNLSIPDHASTNGGSGAHSPQPPALLPTVTHIPKSPICQKSGYLLTPNATQDRWVRRFVELRRPYLHIYSLPDGDEANAIALSNARIDADPQVAKLLRRNRLQPGSPSKGMQVFAVFAPQKAWLFACRGDRDKAEWIVRIDEAFMGSGAVSAGSGSAGDSEDGF